MASRADAVTQPLLCVVHIPKTAGSAIRETLISTLGWDKVYWISHKRPLGHWTNSSGDEFSNYVVVGGHVSAADFSKIKRPKIFMSVLRDPVTRAISLFNYIKRGPDTTHGLRNTFQDLSLIEAISSSASFRKDVENRQCALIGGAPTFAAALRSLCENEWFIDHYDVIDKLFVRVCERFDWPVQKLVFDNVGRKGYADQYLADEPTVTLLKQINKEDSLLVSIFRNDLIRQSHRATSLFNEKPKPEDLVDILFRSVLRREPDSGGRATYSRLLAEGRSQAELLTLLMKSPEFASKRLVSPAELALKKLDNYDLANDPGVAKYATPGMLNAIKKVREPVIDARTFDQVAQESIPETGEMAPSQVQYLSIHRNRFYEIDCIISNLLRQQVANHTGVMDFGLSINSFILRRLFPSIKLSVADRPAICVPANTFYKTFVVDLLDDRLDTIDLNQKFDIIIFSEVIEHVLVHPVNVIRFLLRHLTPHGHTIITTPNLFSQAKLQRISRRQNPLPPYPAEYKRAHAPHFHIREYCMSETLSWIDQAGGDIEGFFFSECWDTPGTRDPKPSHELGNMVFLFGNKTS
jgi:SAM-dependent methyltransferase